MISGEDPVSEHVAHVSDEQFEEFIRQLRDRTYVEYKSDER